MKDEQRFAMEKFKPLGGVFGADVQVITDTETGVQYLFALQGYGAGLTPLLDAEGKPLLNPDYCRGK